MTKECFTCGETKPVSEFTRRRPNGAYRSSCKKCWNRRERLRNNSDKEKKRLTAFKEKEAIERNPSGFLIAGILECAIKDLRNGEPIRPFFDSALFEEYCSLVNMDADYMRENI